MIRTPPALLVLLLLAAGCASAAPPAAGPTTPAATQTSAAGAPRSVPDGMGSGATDGEFPRTVGHFGGSTTIGAAPVRVVALSTGQLDAVLALGVVPVAVTRADGAGLVPGYLATTFPDVAAELAALLDAGTRAAPGVESVAAATPDLVLVNSSVDPGVRAQLAAVAPTVVTEGTGVNWKQDLLLVADALGRTEQARRLLDTFHTDAAALGARLGLAGSPAPTVSFVRANADRVRVFGVASFVGSIAEDAGLPRPTSQQLDATSVDISPEQLDAADGDRIFYGVQGTDPALLTGTGLWPGLGGVVSGHAVRVDDDVWFLNAGPTAARLVLDELVATVA